MKYLVDAREPITVGDIEKALDDANEFLKTGDVAGQLVERLAAIVADTCGYEWAEEDEES